MDAIHFREQNFEWQALAENPGVATKHIGSFTERDVGVQFLRLNAGTGYTLPAQQQKQLVLIKSGTGKFGTGDQWFEHTAVDLAAGDAAEMIATTRSEVLVLRFPRF